MSDLVVKIKDIAKRYSMGKIIVSALAGVSFELNRGEIAAIVGPSGSGKSTLLNLIGGLDIPDRGDIEIDGKTILGMSSSQRAELRARKIGFIFQSYNLIPVLTAFENIELAIWNREVGKSERRKRVLQMLEAVGLEGRANNRPNELSGGQQQRIAIARALINCPSVVLADEPTASLDSKTAEEVMKIMVEMNRSFHVTLLFATHDQHIMKYAGRLIELTDGKILIDRKLDHVN